MNIDSLTINYQKKLIFFLENKTFFEKKKISLNSKIISITEKDIKIEIEKGNFLKRLFDRISTDNINTVSLSNRREDILPILDYYLADIW